MIKILKNKKGSGFIDHILIILVLVMGLALLIKVAPVFTLQHEMNTHADRIARLISVEGKLDSSVEQKIREYLDSTKMGGLTITYDGTDFIDSTKQIQLNDVVCVNIKREYDLGFFTFGSFPVSLESRSTSRSEVYWKH